jgi:hypothetical protein
MFVLYDIYVLRMIDKLLENAEFRDWYNENKSDLKECFRELIIISRSYGIDLITDEYSFEDYIAMMWYESK